MSEDLIEQSPNEHTLEDEELLRAYVGKKANYYLRKWEKFVEGSYRSWNPASFFLSAFWLGYRKMYGYFIIYLVILSMEGIVSRIIVGHDTNFVSIILSLIVGLLGNHIYYFFAKRKIKKMKTKGMSDEELKLALAKVGGTSWKFILFLFLFCIIYGIIIAILFPK